MSLRLVDFPDGFESSSTPTFGSGLGDGTLIPQFEQADGDVDGLNDVFGLEYAPISAESTVVFVNGLAMPRGVAWSLDEDEITFEPDYVPAEESDVWVYYLRESDEIGSTGAIPKTEYVTISGPQALAKAITLSHTPQAPTEVHLDVIGGTAQFYGDDFTVSGATLSWSGLDLDGVLAAGDKLRISYNY